MPSDPFLVEGPAVVSFSGGRTSAYMLWRILQAHGGLLPPDIRVCFANTGREMEATLRFVRDVGHHWQVPIVWLEFVRRHRQGYRVVDYELASRDGQPFASLLSAAPTLPNPVQRSCTQELKIRTMKRWVLNNTNWPHWTNIVGLRSDEPRRLARLSAPTRERWTRIAPLATAGVTKEHVLTFWSHQPFDLGLAGPWQGNCDGCFLKSRASLLRMCQEHPARMAWWAEQEEVPRGTAGVNRQFRSRKRREPYREMLYEAAGMPVSGTGAPRDETMVPIGEGCADGECVI